MSPTECEHVLKQIELYLDGHLVAAPQLDRHPCSGHADFQRKLKEVLRTKCGCREVPADLLERVRSLLERQPDPTA